MKIRLVLEDWRKWDGTKVVSIYNTPDGIDLSTGDFHSGTTFDATIDAGDEEADLLAAMQKGYRPVFWAIQYDGGASHEQRDDRNQFLQDDP